MPVAIASKSQTQTSSPRAQKPASKRGEVHCELLKPQEFAEWDALVDASPHGTVFHYSWWLEVTAEQLEILVIRDANGLVVGGLPLPRSRRSGLELVHGPLLTPYLGRSSIFRAPPTPATDCI